MMITRVTKIYPYMAKEILGRDISDEEWDLICHHYSCLIDQCLDHAVSGALSMAIARTFKEKEVKGGSDGNP